MQRIIELMCFYRSRGNDKVADLMEGFSQILNSGNNDEAEKAAQRALFILEQVAVRKDHINKLKAFIYDLAAGNMKIQPLM